MSDAGGSSGSSGFGGSSPAVDEDFDVIRIIIDVIYAIDDAFGWINRFWDEAASCSWYNRLVREIDKYAEFYSEEADSMLGALKVKISGVQEEREAILSRAIQWCEEIVPSLDMLQHLFTTPESFPEQKVLINDVLETGIENLGIVLFLKMQTMNTLCREIEVTLGDVLTQLSKDFDSNSRYLLSIEEAKRDNFQVMLMNAMNIFMDMKIVVNKSSGEIRNVRQRIAPDCEKLEQIKEVVDRIEDEFRLDSVRKLQQDTALPISLLRAHCEEYIRRHYNP